MNQTTWIVGGGIIIVAIAALLYLSSGDGVTKKSNTETIPAAEVTVDSKPIATSAPTTMETTTTEKRIATLHTSMGDITLKFYPTDAPKTVENFLKLASTGFYNGVRFHRVIKGFMIQAGDPNSKYDGKQDSWGMGGPGYTIPDEFNASSALYQRGYKHGILAMANTSSPNSGGSQFFIMAADYPLPPSYTIFGEVTSGLDVVDAIDAVKTDGPQQLGGHDRPLTPVTIKSVEVR